MSFEPCHIEYDLNRRQRLVAHLGVWAPCFGGLLVLLAGSIVLIVALSFLVSRWFVVLSVVPLLVAVGQFSGFLRGLINVVFVPLQHMDIIVEETALGFMARGERFWAFLDGITGIQKHSKDTWTILHHNGTVINIPVSAIEERHVDHMRTMAEKGKTPEGVQAKIERGRRIMEIEAMDRQKSKEKGKT